MAESKITAVETLNKAIDTINGTLTVTDKKIIAISKNLLKLVKQFSNVTTAAGVNEDLEKTIKLTTSLKEAKKEQRRQENLLIKQIEKKRLATSEDNKQIIKARWETQELNKRLKEQTILSSKLATEYQKQTIKLGILIRKRQDLALKQELGIKLSKTETATLKTLTTQITRKDRALKKVDAQVGRSFRNVGNYRSALMGAAGAARSLASAMGLVGGAFLVVGVIRDAFNRVREFGAVMSTLAGVYRTSREDLADLEEQIISVAGASTKTATEVAQLAETLATLGKTKEEIGELLEPVNNLSIGLKASSDETAEFLVQVINSFGGSSDEAAKYADVIATIRTSTSLDFQKMRDSFQFLTPISKILNKDLAHTGALIGILADNGVKAQRAGRLLGTAQQKLAKEGKTLSDALEEINDASARGIKEEELLAIASELFGKQAATLGIILASNSKIIDTNAQAIRDNTGALDDLISEQLKSLDSHLKILTSRWEEYILNVDESSGASNKLKTVIKFLSDNLKTIIDTISVATLSWVAYKAVLISVNILSKAYRLTSLALAAAKAFLTGNITRSTIALKLFKTELTATGIGAIIVLIGSLAAAFLSLKDASDESAEAARKNSEKRKKLLQKEVDDTISAVKEKIRAYEIEARAKGISDKEIFDTKKKLIEDEIKLINAKTQEEIDAIFELKETPTEETPTEETPIKKRLENLLEAATAGELELKLNDEKIKKDLEKITSATKDEVSNVVREVDKVLDPSKVVDSVAKKKIKELNKLLEELSTSTDTDTDTGISDTAKDAFKLKKFYLEKEIEAQQDLIDNEELSTAKRLEAVKIRTEKEKDLAEATKIFLLKTTKLTIDGEKLLKEKHDAEIIELDNKAEEANKKVLASAFNIFKEDLKNRTLEKELKFEEEKELLDKNFKDGLISEEDYQKELLAIKKKFALAEIQLSIDTIKAKIASGQFKGEELANLEQSLFNLKVSLSDIEKENYLKNLKEKEEGEIAFSNFITDQLKFASSTISNALGIDAGNLESFFTSLKDNVFDGNEKTKISIEEALEVVGAATAVAGDIANSVFDSKIEKIDEEIQANEDKYARLIEQEEGNEALQRKLAAQKEVERKKLEKEKAKEQRKQAVINKVAALANITINTAIAVTKITAEAALASPFLIPLIIASGAVQAAIVAATPIPKFGDGKGRFNDYEGIAIYGEKKREAKISKDGKIELSPKNIGNHLTYVKKDDVIHPDANKLISSLTNEELYNNVHKHSLLASMTGQSESIVNYVMLKGVEKSIYAQTRDLVRELQNNKPRVRINQSINLGDDLNFLNTYKDTL